MEGGRKGETEGETEGKEKWRGKREGGISYYHVKSLSMGLGGCRGLVTPGRVSQQQHALGLPYAMNLPSLSVRPRQL